MHPMVLCTYLMELSQSKHSKRRNMNKSNSSVGEVTAGVVGAAVGATAAVVLSDPKRRRTITKTVKKVVAQGTEVLGTVKDKAERGTKGLEKQMRHAPTKVKKIKVGLQKGMKKKVNKV